MAKKAGRNPIEPRSSQGMAAPEDMRFADLTAGLGSRDAMRKSCGVDFAKNSLPAFNLIIRLFQGPVGDNIETDAALHPHTLCYGSHATGIMRKSLIIMSLMVLASCKLEAGNRLSAKTAGYADFAAGNAVCRSL